GDVERMSEDPVPGAASVWRGTVGRSTGGTSTSATRISEEGGLAMPRLVAARAAALARTARGREHPPASGAGRGGHDRHVVVPRHGRVEITGRLPPHEQADVRAHATLLVDDAEAQAPVLALERREHARKRRRVLGGEH